MKRKKSKSKEEGEEEEGEEEVEQLIGWQNVIGDLIDIEENIMNTCDKNIQKWKNRNKSEEVKREEKRREEEEEEEEEMVIKRKGSCLGTVQRQFDKKIQKKDNIE